eukprot:5396963-Alexandrium_andersonii.AAC.1
MDVCCHACVTNCKKCVITTSAARGLEAGLGNGARARRAQGLLIALFGPACLQLLPSSRMTEACHVHYFSAAMLAAIHCSPNVARHSGRIEP